MYVTIYHVSVCMCQYIMCQYVWTLVIYILCKVRWHWFVRIQYHLTLHVNWCIQNIWINTIIYNNSYALVNPIYVKSYNLYCKSKPHNFKIFWIILKQVNIIIILVLLLIFLMHISKLNNIQCNWMKIVWRLFITTSQPLGLVVFQLNN